MTFQETVQQGVQQGQEVAGRPALTPRPEVRGADPWGECGLPRGAGWAPGGACHVKYLGLACGLQLGRRSTSMEH